MNEIGETTGAVAAPRAELTGRTFVRRAAAALRSGIRDFHVVSARNRSLPPRVAIYFHQLQPDQWAAFRSCISYFTGAGYRPVSAQSFISPGAERRLFVSFDDNFRNWHRALPLFQDLGLKATFYVNTSPFRDEADHPAVTAYLRRLAMTDENETLSRDELVQIHAAGHWIGCHSHSHFNLRSVPRADWDAEILNSKRVLERLIGGEVGDFAWPYGMRRYFSSELRKYCAGVGFSTIANAISGCQAIAANDPYDIFRTDWRLDRPLSYNLENLAIDGRIYARLTGRSVIG